MRLSREFVRLPLRFDAARLQAELGELPADAWRPHPQGHAGNSALSLLAVDGDPTNDSVEGPMEPTPALLASPYIQQVLAAFDAPIGRTRFMRIDAGAEATPHTDTNLYWHDRVRLHVPVITGPEVEFICGEASVHMDSGECWVFDTTRRHNVVNPHDVARVHLVVDTVGSPALWAMIEGDHTDTPDTVVGYHVDQRVNLVTERWNLAPVMHPADQRRLIDEIVGEGEGASVAGPLHGLNRAWVSLWARWGDSPQGRTDYERVIASTRARLAQSSTDVPPGLSERVEHLVLRPALGAPRRTAASPRRAARPAAGVADGQRSTGTPSKFDRPVIIVSPPRAGSTFLFETLSRSPSLHSIGSESHGVIERIGALHPQANGFASNRLTATDATPGVVNELTAGFAAQLRDRDGIVPAADARGIRLLEKTPKNALRVPFLDAAFPDARYIYLYRDPREELSSMLEAWRSGRFITYPDLPGWEGRPWSLLLAPEWRELIGRPLAEVVAAQWATTTSILLDDLEKIDPDRWCVASYEGLVADPAAEVARISQFVDIDWDDPLDEPLPASRHTLTPPAAGKWEANWPEIEPALDRVSDVAARAEELFGKALRKPMPARPARSAAPEAVDAVEPFSSVHTPTVAKLLEQASTSVLVSTYQSGRLITLRADEGKVNTHFQRFSRPMGIAASGGRLALGTKADVWEFRNQPTVASKLGPQKHDACFLPRGRHTTGDISIHEMAYGNDGLWIVNTRFSCLATLDEDHSFVPRWRPDFVSGYAAEDRCHLNGMAMRDGEPAFVTALGTTDVAAGWRENKAHGGCIIDVASGERIVTGLSMPHSPRWYDGSLWVLESGRGGLVRIDAETGDCTTVAELPGFTRGLSFVGPYAFVGLSKVRERVFGGLPLTQTDEPRYCGIWVVDVRSGETVGFVRFEGVVEEIFDVQALPGLRFPELVDNDHELASSSFVLPDEAMAELV